MINEVYKDVMFFTGDERHPSRITYIYKGEVGWIDVAPPSLVRDIRNSNDEFLLISTDTGDFILEGKIPYREHPSKEEEPDYFRIRPADLINNGFVYQADGCPNCIYCSSLITFSMEDPVKRQQVLEKHREFCNYDKKNERILKREPGKSKFR